MNRDEYPNNYLKINILQKIVHLRFWLLKILGIK
jgi:hypothetical protein